MMKRGNFKRLLALALALGLLLSCAASAELDEIISEAAEADGGELDAFWLGESPAPDLNGEDTDAEIAFSLEPSLGADQSLEFWQGGDADDDNDALFAGWLNQVLPNPDGAIVKAPTRVGRTALSGAGLKLYDMLAEKIQAVAAGSISETVFTFTDDDLGFADHWYTAADLGLSDLNDGSAAYRALMAAEGIDSSKLIRALLLDYPYELYWYDKAVGYSLRSSTTSRYSSSSDLEVHIADLQITMSVSADYAIDSKTVNAIPARVNSAVNTINAIISANAGKSDSDKLYAYADEICRLVEYNHAAADDDSTPYGDPWQLICVFDGDTSTNVVCEGYSKALKYLCDLSTFQGYVKCVTMSGYMNGGAHMWNVLAMPDGYYYLADVTNDDDGDTCSMDHFLKGVDGSAGGPYTVSRLTYVLSDTMIPLFGEGSPWFDLSNQDYGTNASKPVETTPTTDDTDTQVPATTPTQEDTDTQTPVITPSTEDTDTQTPVITPSTEDTGTQTPVITPSTEDTDTQTPVITPSTEDTDTQTPVITPSTEDTDTQSPVVTPSTEDTDTQTPVINPSTEDTDILTPILTPTTDDTDSPVVITTPDGTEILVPIILPEPSPTVEGIVIEASRSGAIGVKETVLLTAVTYDPTISLAKLKWTSSNKKVATVDKKGKVTGKSAGTAIITVTNAAKRSASYTVEVRDFHAPITVSISPETPPTIGLKDKLQLTAVMTAESTPQTKLKWASSNKKVAAVDKNGRVTGKAAGTATITVTTANKKTASVTITVEDIHAPTSVRIEPASPAPIPVKGTAQLSAVVEAISTPTTKLKWTTSNKKVATVDKNGKVTGKAAGTATITVTTSNKLSASVQVTVE